MIAFGCPQCGMKFKIKPEFAGRAARCPACTQPRVVPALGRAAAPLPSKQIDGTASSLHLELLRSNGF